MDRNDEHCGRMEEAHLKMQSAYCQFRSKSLNLHKTVEQNKIECVLENTETGDIVRLEDLEDIVPGLLNLLVNYIQICV